MGGTEGALEREGDLALDRFDGAVEICRDMARDADDDLEVCELGCSERDRDREEDLEMARDMGDMDRSSSLLPLAKGIVESLSGKNRRRDAKGDSRS